MGKLTMIQLQFNWNCSFPAAGYSFYFKLDFDRYFAFTLLRDVSRVRVS